MNAKLKNFATRHSAHGKPVGGQGREKLTEKRMKQWSTYYRNAISENVGKCGYHAKTDYRNCPSQRTTAQIPPHDNCPEGTESWYFHQKAVAEGKAPQIPKKS